jgi:hypothetical protein
MKKSNDDYLVKFEKDAREILEEALATLIKKQEDYGPKNISTAPGGPLNGLMVRLHDKMERLKNLIYNNRITKNESVEDSFLDSMNYNLIALMVLRGKWDNWE